MYLFFSDAWGLTNLALFRYHAINYVTISRLGESTCPSVTLTLGCCKHWILQSSCRKKHWSLKHSRWTFPIRMIFGFKCEHFRSANDLVGPALMAAWSWLLESHPGHVRKFSVTWGYAVVFAGYSGSLHQLQLAIYDQTAIWQKTITKKWNSKFRWNRARNLG